MNALPDDRLADRIVIEALRREPAVDLPPDFAERVARRAMPWRPTIPWLELAIASVACSVALTLGTPSAESPAGLGSPVPWAALAGMPLHLVASVAISLVAVAFLDHIVRPARLRGLG
jgi:hypothetical protein